MTQSYEGPERRASEKVPFISMDAAMLAVQTEQLKVLNAGIEKLTTAVGDRPTKHDLEQTRKRLRNQLIITIVLFFILACGLYYEQQKAVQGCEDRNDNTIKFRTLIAVLVQEGSRDQQVTPVETALTDYLTTLKEVDC